jgi:hypothetical protein
MLTVEKWERESMILKMVMTYHCSVEILVEEEIERD